MRLCALLRLTGRLHSRLVSRHTAPSLEASLPSATIHFITAAPPLSARRPVAPGPLHRPHHYRCLRPGLLPAPAPCRTLREPALSLSPATETLIEKRDRLRSRPPATTLLTDAAAASICCPALWLDAFGELTRPSCLSSDSHLCRENR
ncbi:hypothetical protein V2G26_019301 [Clonostachys chloroleuca]